MKRYVKDFILKGLIACGFGPIIWAIVYFFLEKNGVAEVLTVNKAITEIITAEILAFVAGGVNIVYQIERLPLMAAISVHGVVLYLDYVMIYLLNGWLHSGIMPLLIFTVCFFAGYAVIWTGIYFGIKRNADRMNRKLSQLRKQAPARDKK
ncbi:MAG: DUF3021 domain-containing protein [Clostridia bacterium]|nr:DUF3021 domain-containing protein [Clostridia bacterium]